MKKVILAVALLAMTGCATQTYHINSGTASATPDKDDMQTFFVSGLGQEKELDAAAVCGGADKVVKVQSKLEFIDVILGMLTSGIYTPRHAKVYCKK